MERKPEDGAQIQYVACGRICVFVRLKIMKASEDYDPPVIRDKDLAHGGSVLLNLVHPWLDLFPLICTFPGYDYIEVEI